MKTLVKGTRLTFSLLNFALEVIEQGFRMVAHYSHAAEEKLAAEEQRLYAHMEKVELMLSSAESEDEREWFLPQAQDEDHFYAYAQAEQAKPLTEAHEETITIQAQREIEILEPDLSIDPRVNLDDLDLKALQELAIQRGIPISRRQPIHLRKYLRPFQGTTHETV